MFLIVDDSAVMRQLLSSVLAEDPEIEVVGTAADPHIARERIKALNPDVVTLDVEMPHMDGLTFLRKIMTLRPTPVVMISTLTQRGADTTLEALEIGAVDFVAKPTNDLAHGLADLAAELQKKVKAAAAVRVGVRRLLVAPKPPRAAATTSLRRQNYLRGGVDRRGRGAQGVADGVARRHARRRSLRNTCRRGSRRDSPNGSTGNAR